MWEQLKQLGKHSAIYGLGNIATSLLSFLLVPLYTNNLNPTQFGVYSLLITVYSVLAVFVDCGLAESLSRYYFDNNADSTPEQLTRNRRVLLSTGLMLSAGLTVVTATVIFLLSSWLALKLFHETSYAHFIRLMAGAVLFRGLTTVPLSYVRVTERVGLFTLATVGQLALFLAFNVLFLVYLKRGIEGIFLSLMISMAFYAISLLLLNRRDLNLQFDRVMARQLLSFGLPLLPLLLMMWVIDLSDRYLLGQFTTLTQVGIYSLGYKFGQAMSFVVTAFTYAWTPLRFKILGQADPQVIYGRIATFYLAGAGSVWMILTWLAPHIIHWTSPSEFATASIYIAPVAMAYLIYGLFVLALTGIGVAKNAFSLPLIGFVAVCVNIGLNILLIPRFGAIASAYATVIAYIVLTLSSLWASHRLYPIHYEYRKLVSILVTMLAAGIGGANLDIYIKGSLTISIIFWLLLICLYWVAMLAIGLLHREETIKLINLVARISPTPLRARLNRVASNLQSNKS